MRILFSASIRPLPPRLLAALVPLALVLATSASGAPAAELASVAAAAASRPAPAAIKSAGPAGQDETSGAREPTQQEPPSGTDAEAPAQNEAVKAFPGVGVNIPQVDKRELPPGAKWRVDDRGFRYYLKEIPKSAQWQWFSDTHIRVGRVEIYEVGEEREDAFLVKIFEMPHGVPTKPRREATEEEVAAVAATFEPRAAASDRLRFRDFGAGLPQSGQWRNGFAVADANGDGHLDIVHGPPRKGGAGRPVIFVGDGAGNWRVWEQVRFPPFPYTYGDAAAADLNGDGHVDVVLGQHLQGVVAMISDGRGGFELWNRGLPWDLPGRGGSASGFSSREVTIADWNGDGLPDILALGEGPRPARQQGPSNKMGLLPSSSFGVAIFINQGDGSWRQLDRGLDADQVFGDHLAVGDLNGDGRLDFAASSMTFGRRALLGIADAEDGWRYAELEGIRERAYIHAVAAGDFDGDGRLDLAMSALANQADHWWSAVDVFLARRDGWERHTVHGDRGREEWASALAAGDLDGDGNEDLVAVTDGGNTWVFLGDGEGGWTREDSEEIPSMPGGCTGYGLTLVDLDGDGRDEIMTGFAGEPSAMFAPDRCPSLGALRAWKVEPAQDAEQPAG